MADQTVGNPMSCRTRRFFTASMACAARSGLPARLTTDQLCGSESIWHSVLVLEPKGSPLSK
jgi:hypothetical protein